MTDAIEIDGWMGGKEERRKGGREAKKWEKDRHKTLGGETQ